MKIHVPRDKFEVASWMFETWCVAKVVTDWTSKEIIFCLFFLYIRVRVFMRVVMILTKEQNIIIIALRKK